MSLILVKGALSVNISHVLECNITLTVYNVIQRH